MPEYKDITTGGLLSYFIGKTSMLILLNPSAKFVISIDMNVVSEVTASFPGLNRYPAFRHLQSREGLVDFLTCNQKMSEMRMRCFACVQPSTRSTLGVYDGHPLIARYVWYCIVGNLCHLVPSLFLLF